MKISLAGLLCLGGAFLATGLSAVPLSQSDVEGAAGRWLKGNPLFGATAQVRSSEQVGDMVFVHFTPRGCAAFSMDTTLPPCRWFSTQDSTADGSAARAALKSPGEPDATHEVTWKSLLVKRSKLSAKAMPAGAVTVGTVVGPLTKRNWSQERHYNRMCPLRDYKNALRNNLNDDRMLSGCVATALAMYLDYYQWPLHGVGSAEESVIKASFGADYNYGTMLDRYTVIASQEQTLAVAQLMADCGATVGMGYGDDASSSSFDNYSAALENHFGYDHEGVLIAGRILDNTNFVAAAKAHLAAGNPILCNGKAGENPDGEAVGHAYLCDGYCEVLAGNTTNTYYHFNFGWNGSGNDWCTPDNVITHAQSGGESAGYELGNMLIGLTPTRAPQFHRLPSVATVAQPIAWEIANYWTNALEGLSLEIQKSAPVTVSTNFPDSAWNIRTTGFGWEYVDGKATAKIVTSMGSNRSYPYMGLNACLNVGVAISAETTLTIQYAIKEIENGTSIYITTSDAEGNPLGWDNSNLPIPRLATISSGDSPEFWTTRTLTLTGTGALASLVGQRNVMFCIYFVGGASTSYSRGDEIFKILSTSLSGTADDWVTQQTMTLAKTDRSATLPQLVDGKYRFKLVADYGESMQPAVGYTTMDISTTQVPPSISRTETANALIYTIGNAANFNYTFRCQHDSVEGTAVKSGNTITYTLPAAINTLGTHWIELVVTNSDTGHTASDYTIINKPVSAPLAAYTEYTYEDALARATREDKNICMFSVRDQYTYILAGLDDVLASSNLVEAIRNKFIVWENFAGDDPGAETLTQYWVQQPGKNGFTGDSFPPNSGASLFLISPENPTIQIPGDTLPLSYWGTTRWDYDNAQYDITSNTELNATDITRFLSQTFAAPVVSPAMTYVREAFATANTSGTLPTDLVVRSHTQRHNTTAEGIPAAEAAQLLSITPTFAAGTGADADKTIATVDYEFGITNITLDGDAVTLTVQVLANNNCIRGTQLNGTLQVYAVVNGQDVAVGSSTTSPQYGANGSITLPPFTPAAGQSVFKVKVLTTAP